MNSFNQIDEKYSLISKSAKNLSSYEQRRDYLLLLKKKIQENSNQIIIALKEDLAKSEFESYLGEIDFTIHEIDITLKKLKDWMKPTKVRSSFLFFPVRSYIYKEPYGQVLIIGPWNYPFQLIMAPLIGAIAAGNAAIVKPSEMSPATSKVLVDIFKGELSSCVECVEGGVEETTKLLDLKFDYIFYTGNGVVGRIIMQKAAKFLTPVTLELGGKSPCFVYSKNLDLSAKRIMWGKFFNAGQTCVAPDYVLISKNDEEDFVKLSAKWLKYFYTNEVSKSLDYGRIINERHYERLTNYLGDCEILYGGDVEKSQKYISPTIVRPSIDSQILKEEIFGPILPIINFETIDESINYVKKGDKPLACYGFFDSDLDKEKIIKEISSGGMVINDTLVHLSNDSLPFGGVGESGMGAYHGKHSFDLFSHKKAVMKRSFLFENNLRYPPYAGKLNLIRRLLKWLG